MAYSKTNNDPSEDDGLLTAGQSAKLLGVSLATFRRRVADQTIPGPLKIGGSARWSKREILTVIEIARAERDRI